MFRSCLIPRYARITRTLEAFLPWLDEIYSDTRHQNYWVHKTANVPNALQKSAQPKAKQVLRERSGWLRLEPMHSVNLINSSTLTRTSIRKRLCV